MASSTYIVGAIDIGTTYSGWASSMVHDYKSDPTKVFVKNWKSGTLVSEKTPTVVLIKSDGKTIEEFGYEAENKFKELVENGGRKDYYYFKRFKMTLNKRMDENINRKNTIEDEFGRSLPAMTVFSSSIKFLSDDLVNETKKQVGDAFMKSDVKWVLTVPAIWTDSAKQFMREAAIEAGIDTNKLIIALEPEAASIYCRHLFVDRLVIDQGASIYQFAPGTKYMILDAGGGTIDITVHEIQRKGGLKELHAASGGGWGGILVDEAFNEFLIDVIGKRVYKTFKEEETEDWIDLWRNFETKKKSIEPTTSSKVVMRFPLSITTIFEKGSRRKLAEDISKSKYSNDVELAGDKIKLNADLVKGLFKQSIQKTVEYVKTIMKHPKVRGIKAILMVGGYSDSPMLQNAVKAVCPGISVMIPKDAVSTILKGAVIFGHEPNAITERVLKYTYGVATLADFIEGVHPESKKVFLQKRGFVCTDVFDKHVEKSQSVQVGESLTPQHYKALSRSEKFISVPIYASELHNPQFIDQGCTSIGSMYVEMPCNDGDLNRAVSVSFAFGGTEIEVTGRDEMTGKKTNLTIDYQVHSRKTMTWHEYVKDHLMTPGDMCGAGIYGHDGGEWAAEGPVRPNQNDIVRLINIMTGKDRDFNTIEINGVPFMCIGHNKDERIIKLVQKAELPRERYHFACCMSNNAFIFGVVLSIIEVGNCCECMCRLRGHLDQSLIKY